MKEDDGPAVIRIGVPTNSALRKGRSVCVHQGGSAGTVPTPFSNSRWVLATRSLPPPHTRSKRATLRTGAPPRASVPRAKGTQDGPVSIVNGRQGWSLVKPKGRQGQPLVVLTGREAAHPCGRTPGSAPPQGLPPMQQ